MTAEERAALLALLRAVEWRGPEDDVIYYGKIATCPICGGRELDDWIKPPNSGHREGCELAGAIVAFGGVLL